MLKLTIKTQMTHHLRMVGTLQLCISYVKIEPD